MTPDVGREHPIEQPIAVLGGTGALGQGLARRFRKAGLQVIVGSRTTERAEEVAATLNAATPHREPDRRDEQ